MSNPERYAHVAKQIAESLETIGILSEVLMENTVAVKALTKARVTSS